MFRAAGSVVLGTLVTCTFTFALTTLGTGLLFGLDRPNTWLLVLAIMAACTIPFFLGSMVAAYVGQRSGWRLALVVCLVGTAFLLVAFFPMTFGQGLLDSILTFVMASGLAVLFSLFGGMLGERILIHRRRVRAAIAPLDIQPKAIDANTQEP